jgi:DNA primase catalytic core
MRQRLVNLEAVTLALRPYLEQYLQEHGFDTSKHFLCLNPKHADSNASMTCKQHRDNAYCFGCHTTADIFQAAHFLEGKPLKGKEFIEENVMYLANKYGVQATLEDLTQEEIYEYKTYDAYKLASQLVSNRSFGDYALADAEIARRGWDKEKVAGWGIGTVNFKEFKEKMESAGYDAKFLAGIDLDRQNLFGNHNLLFTVYDEYGRPVGFSARNLKHKKDSKDSGPKYLNTKGTDLECAIFKKGERLYGFEIAREAPSPLYIFEGQSDVITARHFGLMNCCCTLGTALTDYHVNLLKKHGIFNITLVFDSDAAGEAATLRVLDDKFAKEKEFRVKLCQLPDGEDPDELLRKRGIDEFVRLKKWTAFEWRMARFMEEKTDELGEDKRQEIAEKMAQIIASERSIIRQEEMAKQVARMTGYDLSTITSEVKRLRSEQTAEVHARKKAVFESMVWEVQKNPEEAEQALVQAQHLLSDINKSAAPDGGNASVLSSILAQKEHDETKSGEFAGFFMRPNGLGGIGARMNDDWRTDALVYIGGSEQAGKTTFAAQMAYEIADDDRNDAICIYHSIDDAARMILYKWVCLASGDTKLLLNHVSNPKYWTAQGIEWVSDAREQAYRKVIQMVKDEKLVLKDASDGQSLYYITEVIRSYREKYPTKRIVFFGDNFHKYPDYAEIQGHERIKRLSNLFKNMTVTNHITAVATVEYRKLAPGEKPTNVAIAESRSLAYDASAIIHLYNDLHHSTEEEAVLIHKDEEDHILPRIWVKFGKNKISGYEGRDFLDLFGAAGQYRSVELETALREQRERIEFLKENKNRIL